MKRREREAFCAFKKINTGSAEWGPLAVLTHGAQLGACSVLSALASCARYRPTDQSSERRKRTESTLRKPEG